VKEPHIEIECKLIARDASALAGVRQALRKVCSSVRYLGREVIRDAYLETPDWRLYRAGYACRIRRTSRHAPGRAVLGLKSLQRPRRGVSTREELERTVSSSRYRRGLSGALRREGDLGARILGLLEGREARVIFRIRNRRETYAVRFGNRLRAHVSLDDFTLSAGAKRRRLAEVEIEIQQGTAEELRRLAGLLLSRVGLSMQTRAKFRQGLELAALTPGRRRPSCLPAKGAVH
jgi:inorganic triphosphatase YgiF